jgi:hypothetical protein
MTGDQHREVLSGSLDSEFFFFYFFWDQIHYLAQAGLKLMILLLQLLEYWDCRCAPPCPSRLYFVQIYGRVELEGSIAIYRLVLPSGSSQGLRTCCSFSALCFLTLTFLGHIPTIFLEPRGCWLSLVFVFAILPGQGPCLYYSPQYCSTHAKHLIGSWKTFVNWITKSDQSSPL